MRTAQQAAILLVAILKRSGQLRARLSAKTIRLLADRRHLRVAFVNELADALAEYSWTFCEINSGGYAVIRTKSLEAAKAATAKRWLTDEEREQLKRGSVKWSRFEREAASQEEEPISDDND